MEKYQVLGVIGKGSFGTVSRIRRRADGKVLVWKEINYGKMSEREKQLVVSEVNFLRELRHPFIVKYYDRIIDKVHTKLYIVMEACDGGDLARLIKKCRKDKTFLKEEVIWKIFAQLLLALKECHRHVEKGKVKPILHRDIKPGNVFMDRENNVKLGDFGLAKELASKSKFAFTNVGTPFYMSPEIVNELRYNEASDIWALGCLLFELAALRPPFEAMNQVSLAVKINAGHFSRIPSRYSSELNSVVRRMLAKRQNDRPRCEILLREPRLQAYLKRGALRVESEQFENKCRYKQRDMQKKAEELRQREAAVAAKEKKLRDLEARLRQKETDLLRRESALQHRTPPPLPMGKRREALNAEPFGELHNKHAVPSKNVSDKLLKKAGVAKGKVKAYENWQAVRHALPLNRNNVPVMGHGGKRL